MNLDILFIHPNASKKIYQGLSNEHSAIEPPIWAGMLANHCRGKNFNVRILDCEVERLDYISSAKEIHDLNPKLLVLLYMVSNHLLLHKTWKEP